MLCTNCHKHYADDLMRCPSCGQPTATSWDILATAYPPQDDIIKSLLESCGIPVILRSREGIGRVQGLSIGPLAEVRVMVPRDRLSEAIELLAAADAQGPPERDKSRD
ncbi:MAG: DUF2007 domain-containing protein [Syntrophomonadaceae bacterium]|jgi:RNA polymerase subunit RPABC4/transcription elongation factor Spt4|nr:DUF2007 domain-containing protein [Syntrophomonadaceae bacterium]